MKKYLLIVALVLVGGVYLHSTPPQTITKEVPVIQTKIVKEAPPIYHVGDTQSGITLVGIYHSSYQSRMGVNGPTPPTVNVIAFAVSGVNQNNLDQYSAVLTPSGFNVSKPPLTTVNQCGNNACAVFLDVGTPLAFYYKDLKWSL